MSKKLKKLLFLGAVVGSAAGAVCYFARKKNAAQEDPEEDYDDFSVDTETTAPNSGSYVPLTPETENAEEAAHETTSEEESKKDETFTPLAEQVASTEEKTEEAVEEFFDEEDSSDAEPPVNQ